jgi:hypothetical protein
MFLKKSSTGVQYHLWEAISVDVGYLLFLKASSTDVRYAWYATPHRS